MRVLLLAFELADPIFSGNGVWGRSLVRGLLRAEPTLSLVIVCGAPAVKPELERCSDAPGGVGQGETYVGGWPEAEVAEWGGARLSVRAVPVPQWGRLDRASAWEAFVARAPAALAVRSGDGAGVGTETAFDLCIGVDWHALPVLEALRRDGLVWRDLRFVFFNVRVFSANLGISPEDKEFYARLEGKSVATAVRTVAQTQHDADALAALGFSAAGAQFVPLGASAVGPVPQPNSAVTFLHCPLRDDLRQLAIAAGDGDVSARRRYILCVARLSPEKNVEAFVDAIETIGANVLAAMGVTPLLIGAPSSPPAYGEALVARLMRACPAAEYRGFGPPEALAEIYKTTLLNFHGALAEPYGMSLVEVAAFGTPSLLNIEGIGAAERLRPSHGEAFAVRMDDSTAVARRLKELLGQREEVILTGARAKDRALAWSEAEFAEAVLRQLQSAAGQAAVQTEGACSPPRDLGGV